MKYYYSRYLLGFLLLTLAWFNSFAQPADTLNLLKPDTVEISHIRNIAKVYKGCNIGGLDLYDIAKSYSQQDTVQLKVKDNDTLYWQPSDKSFICMVGSTKFVIKSSAVFYKYIDNDIVGEFGFDLGTLYNINDVRYFLNGESIVFIFFVTESFKDYTVIASFNQSNLLNARRISIGSCCKFEKYLVDKNLLTLIYDEGEVKLDLKKDLTITDIGYEEVMKKKYKK